jgi:hypothetical protein
VPPGTLPLGQSDLSGPRRNRRFPRMAVTLETLAVPVLSRH